MPQNVGEAHGRSKDASYGTTGDQLGDTVLPAPTDGTFVAAICFKRAHAGRY